jgi:hypothetical protein
MGAEQLYIVFMKFKENGSVVEVRFPVDRNNLEKDIDISSSYLFRN